MTGAALAVLGFLPVAAASAQASKVAGFDPLTPWAAQPEGRIEIVAWVEREGQAAELVISLAPLGTARLVADPGIAVTPRQARNIRWHNPEGPDLAQPGTAYFDRPLVLRLPFEGRADAVSAEVTYAWCQADRVCLFGEATVTAAMPPEG